MAATIPEPERGRALGSNEGAGQGNEDEGQNERSYTC